MSEPTKHQEWSVTPEQRDLLESVAHEIAWRIGQVIAHGPLTGKLGFLFSIFTWQPGFITYVSNSNRADTVKALRELADALERGEESRPIKEN